MAWFKPSSRFTILAVALTLGLTVNVPVSVQAQDTFRPPRTSTGSPDNTQSGGTRGPECMVNEQKPVALVPASEIGATVAEFPTLYWYMPKSRAKAVEFVLRDANQQQVYSVKYSLAQYTEKTAQGDDYFVEGSPGIMSLTVPASAGLSPLEIGKEYQWDLTVVCDPANNDPADHDNRMLMTGGLKRVQADSNLALRAQQASPEERVALYQNAQLWYEAVGTIVELQRQRPTDRNLAATWDKLLNSVGL